MIVRAIRVAVLLSALSTAGCGTVANLAHTNVEDGGRAPFGGVKRDLACLHKADGEPGAGAPRKPEAEPYPGQVLAVLCAADLPFSFIGDVLTWPYTAAYTVVNAPVPVPPVVLADAPTAQPPTPPVPPETKPMPIPIPPAPLPPDGLPKPEKRP